MKSNFENLRVYPLAENISDRIWDLVMEWDFFAKDTVGKQLVRAADSGEREHRGRRWARQLRRQLPVRADRARVAQRNKALPPSRLSPQTAQGGGCEIPQAPA